MYLSLNQASLAIVAATELGLNLSWRSDSAAKATNSRTENMKRLTLELRSLTNHDSTKYNVDNISISLTLVLSLILPYLSCMLAGSY